MIPQPSSDIGRLKPQFYKLHACACLRPKDSKGRTVVHTVVRTAEIPCAPLNPYSESVRTIRLIEETHHGLGCRVSV